MLLGCASFTYLKKKWEYESDRWMQYQRRQNLENMPAHHFSNRGGVLMEKEFVGFEKYYRNGDDLTAWYQKVYPTLYKNESEGGSTGGHH